MVAININYLIPMVRIPIWFNKDEEEKIKKKCESCNQSPYGYIKELVMLDVNKNVGTKQRNVEENGRTSREKTNATGENVKSIPKQNGFFW